MCIEGNASKARKQFETVCFCIADENKKNKQHEKFDSYRIGFFFQKNVLFYIE